MLSARPPPLSSAPNPLSISPPSPFPARGPPSPSTLPLSPRRATTPRFSASYTSSTERDTRTRHQMATAAATTTSSSFYDVLGLSTGASCQEVKAAYRRLARSCHPDVVAFNRKGSSADEFIRIHAAYSILSDPDKRADYDRKLLMTSRRRGLYRSSTFSDSRSASFYSSSSTGSSSSGFARRTWETDQCW